MSTVGPAQASTPSAASVRSRAQCSCCRGAVGRWRCRWIAHLFVGLDGRRAAAGSSRCRPSPAIVGRVRVRGRARRARRAAAEADTVGDARVRAQALPVPAGARAALGSYATSIAQLVAGVAPVMGWGPIPSDAAGRARFVRAHRRSVQRWLDDLQAAGVLAHEPERDTAGMWWRTQIVLLTAPEPGAAELATARGRARGWKRRERARQRRARVAPSLAAIRGRSGVPCRRRRARAAIERGVLVRERARRAAAEEQISRAKAMRAARRDLDASLRGASYVGALAGLRGAVSEL